MTDREWLESLPADAEFVGLRRGLACRPEDPGPKALPRPSPDHVFVGGDWVLISELRTWPLVNKPGQRAS
jgi:hypothetical protein